MAPSTSKNKKRRAQWQTTGSSNVKSGSNVKRGRPRIVSFDDSIDLASTHDLVSTHVVEDVDMDEEEEDDLLQVDEVEEVNRLVESAFSEKLESELKNKHLKVDQDEEDEEEVEDEDGDGDGDGDYYENEDDDDDHSYHSKEGNHHTVVDDDDKEEEWILESGFDDETVSWSSVEEKQYYQDLLMKIGGNKKARKKAKPFCKASCKVVIDNDFFQDPIGEFAKCLTIKQVNTNCGIYAILSKDGKRILKIGYAMDLLVRRGKYVEKGLEPSRFVVMVDFDATDKKVNDEMEKIYQDFLMTMQESEDLHAFIRLRFELLDKGQGDRMGSKKKIWLQLIESGFQLKFGLPSPQEFLMFDEVACDRYYEIAETNATFLLSKISKIVALAKEKGRDLSKEIMFLLSIGSWKPGHGRMSSNELYNKCFVGDDESMFKDPLPFPSKLAATTNQVFDTSSYTPGQKKGGRELIFQSIQALLKSEFGLIFLDTNNLVLRDDKRFGKDVHQVLQEMGFTEAARSMHNELVLYRDKSELHGVLVRRPPCVADDSRAEMPMEFRLRRGLANATCANIGRVLRGLPMLTKDDKYSNPVNSIMVFQVTMKGEHHGPRQSAAFARACSSSKGAPNPLVENGLCKTATQSHPVALSLRQKKQYGKTDRPTDDRILTKARSKLSRMVDDDTTSIQVYHSLTTLFKSGSGANDARLTGKRWCRLRDCHVIEGSKLYHILAKHRKEFANNSGNTIKGPGKAPDKTKVKSNDDAILKLLGTHGPQLDNQQPFWVRQGAKSKRPPDGTVSEFGDEVFPGDYTVFNDLAIEGFKNRFSTSKAKNKKNNTACKDRFTHDLTGYSYTKLHSRVKGKQRNPIRVLAPGSDPKKKVGYLLAKLTYKEKKEDN